MKLYKILFLVAASILCVASWYLDYQYRVFIAERAVQKVLHGNARWIDGF